MKPKEKIIVDHLFRHQYGKMVAILSKIFGLYNIELIEDAVQDTFIKATLKWRNNIPDHPEAWLLTVAKNRMIDLLRQSSNKRDKNEKVILENPSYENNDYFLTHEVNDSQLQMIFMACHPQFSEQEQIAFALKCIAGFSMREIAASLLQKEETIKKRITRARQKIKEQHISLSYPDPHHIQQRLKGVLQIIYLIFNEGFHSTKQDHLVNKELCGEALRLCKILLSKEKFRTANSYGLFALLCFHSSRLDSKIANNKIIDLQNQDRSLWYRPLIDLGKSAFYKSKEYNGNSIYQIEASIALQHLMAKSFNDTDWKQILSYYDDMYTLIPSDHILLSKATIFLYCKELELSFDLLKMIDENSLNQRKYLYHGCLSEYYVLKHQIENAIIEIDLAINICSNELEKNHLLNKKMKISLQL